MTIIPILIDARNFDALVDELCARVGASNLVGLDIETHDRDAHQGIKDFRKEETAKVFDVRRTTVTGFSLYPDGDQAAYYVNLAHADIENRVPWEKARRLLDAKNPEAKWVIHNSPFEMTMMGNSLGYEVENSICTLQLAVTAYGPDEYPAGAFLAQGLTPLNEILVRASVLFDVFEKKAMDNKQQKLLSKVLGKENHSAESWNGLVWNVAYGYGLKKAIKSHFDYDMTTFEQVLGDKADMGELTGEDVVAYGADDAYWAVRLYHHLVDFIVKKDALTLETFFNQENPMTKVYADLWRTGVRLNQPAIKQRQGQERAIFAQQLRELKAEVRAALPFPVERNERLAKYDAWYAKGFEKYRKKLSDWALTPDGADDYSDCTAVSCAVGNAWAEEKGKRKLKDLPSIMHYYLQRIMLYDLLRVDAIVDRGKVQSNGAARGTVKEKLEKAGRSTTLVDTITKMAGVDQRMKLYLTPYLKLVDPETDRVYPTLSSKLATRRMAMSNPNGMQLAKRGGSTYVRGFYLADEDDHVLVSLDWSQIELVLIGEFSGDPEFAKAYGQLPYEDIHTGTAAAVLGISEEMFKNLATTPDDQIPPHVLIKPNGESIPKDKAFKYWRGEVGKISNFGYWYSGSLNTTAKKMLWSPEKMWEATEKYRSRFPVAEQWRLDTITDGRMTGQVMLPDHTYRVKLDATYDFGNILQQFFDAYCNRGISAFGREVISTLQKRAGNQLVNAKIQGSCATLAKRSILRINARLKELGVRGRFLYPVHDELVFSIHRDDLVKFLRLARQVMTEHPDIIKNLKVDCTASVGLTFEPWDKKSAPFGQIELDEAPSLPFIPEIYWGKKLPEELYPEVVRYLYEEYRNAKSGSVRQEHETPLPEVSDLHSDGLEGSTGDVEDEGFYEAPTE